MLILAKSILGLMIGFFGAVILGWFLIPYLKKLKYGQKINKYVKFAHAQKEGTPTIGGLIFIIPTLIAMILLYLRGSLEITPGLLLVIFIFVTYGALGFADDYIKIVKKRNKGLSPTQKLIIQVLIAIVFFYVCMRSNIGTNLTISVLNLDVDLKWFYGLFVLFLLVGSANAVNLTDGLDGLSGGLSLIAFLCFGILSWGSTWISGYQEIAIFCFVLTGALLGFLVYNAHPAKVFMGDTGSMALGATLAAVAILTKHELSLAVIGGVFVIETLSCILQVFHYKTYGKRIFLMTPIHHHFEKLGWPETDIVRLFYIVGFGLGMIAVYYGVWL